MSEKEKKVIKWIIAIMCGVICMALAFRSYKNNKAWNSFDQTLEAYQNSLDTMTFSCDKEGYITNVEVDYRVSYGGEGEKFESRKYYYTITISLDNKLNELSDKEKCRILARFRSNAYNELKRWREKCGYQKALDELCYRYESQSENIKYRGRFIDINREVLVRFHNDQAVYTLDYSDFEIVDWSSGEYETTKYDYHYDKYDDKLTRFEEKVPEQPKTKAKVDIDKVKEKSESASSLKKEITSNGSKSKKKVYNNGSRDIDDVDIDSFYEDNRDEFEDYDDAWDYMEDNPEEWDDY